MPEEHHRSGGDGPLEESTQKWMVAGLVLMALLVLAFPLYRLYEPNRRADARIEQKAFLADQGAELFSGNCASCHGVAGSGAMAPAVGAREFLESVEDAQITTLIEVGIPGSEMVGYSNDFGGPMTGQEINAITTYLRSLEEEAISKPNWRTPLEDENLSANELYTLACSRCHGRDLRGIEDVAPDISEGSDTQEEPDAFLIGRISNGYKAMPRFGNILTPEQIASVVAFMRGNPTPATTTTTVPPDDGSTTTVPPDDGSTTTTTLAAVGSTTTVPPDPSTDAVLALGQRVWDVTAGGDGCQECHGVDGSGTPSGPNIIGASRSAFLKALNGGTEDMDFELTDEEIDAVIEYMRYLTSQAQP